VRAVTRLWADWIAPALAGVVCFAAAAALLDPGLRGGGAGALAEADRAAIRAALDDYHRIYQDFFASGGVPALLDEFPASKDVRHHVFRDVGFVRDAGLVLVQDLATLTVVADRATAPDRAEVDTFEEWNYVFQSAGDRKPASAPKGLGQGFRYSLRREGTGWKVLGWDLADVAAPAADGGRRW
jgi:hypothetical protein